ncbi:MAG: DNA polymerase I, partial [Acetobacteraceae bacterium]|nr:DNA polymerase I [Acetobacteraceae bacterium]
SVPSAGPAPVAAMAGSQGALSFAAPQPATTPAMPGTGAGYGPYVTVTTIDALQAWITEATAAGVVALATATERLDATSTLLVGIALATASGRACYVPLAHDGAAEQLPRELTLAAFAPLLRDRAVLKVFSDAKFALAVLAEAGAPVAEPVDDVTLISYAQEAGAHAHTIEELAPLHLGHTPASPDSITGTGRNRLPLRQVPLDGATAVAAEGADITLRLWHTLRPRLRTTKSLALYEQMERRLIGVLMQMERAGIRVDADELRRMSDDFSVRMATMERDIHRLAGEPFNLGSPKQLGEILFDRMGLPGGRRMKTGAYGTDSSVLQALADLGHELPGRILEWRQIAKLKSTYADALIEQISPATGRVHTSYAMAVASTVRLSSNDPNLQNIPIRTEEGSRIRRAFVAEPGHVLISADYSQIELRLLAHVADIPQLRDSFLRAEDIHTRTASEVFGVPMEGMDPMTRRRAKAINFGIIYGISAFGLGRQLGIPSGEARAYIDAYFARYPGIRGYMERTREDARINGYVLTPFGRRCWVPGIADKNPARRGYAERQAINAPLQGGGADVIKRAMVRLPAALQEAGLRARLLLQVHDELLFEAPEDEADRTAEIARAVMEAAADLAVPLVVETGRGRSWAEAH